MSHNLFTLTESHLETGLLKVPVGYCVTSYVDPQKGLFYAGYPISWLVDKDPLEVIYLLYRGRMGTEQEMGSFRQELERRSGCSPEEVTPLPKVGVGNPAHLFASWLLTLERDRAFISYEEQVLEWIAKIPAWVGLFIACAQGWQPRSDLTLPMEPFSWHRRFVAAVGVNPLAHLSHVISLISILHFDHGGGSFSSFIAKNMASGLASLLSSEAAGFMAQGTYRSAQESRRSLDNLFELEAKLQGDLSPLRVRALLEEKLSKEGTLAGFGHPLLEQEDLRAKILYDYGQKHFQNHPLIQLAHIVRSEGTSLLALRKNCHQYPNVHAINGALLWAAGWTYPQYLPLVIGMARSVGTALQILYERTEAGQGQGLPMVQPYYLYRSR
jgi:citrate synthase